MRAENIVSWCEWFSDGLNGKITSLTNVKGRLFASVDRTIDGITKTNIEYFDFTRSLDSSSFATDTAKKVWTGFNHLMNETVSVVANGDTYLGDFLLVGGTLTLDTDETDIEVGVNYLPIVEPMPPEFAFNNNISAGLPKRIVKVGIDLQSSASIQVAGEKLDIYATVDDPGASPVQKSGFQEFYIRGWSLQPTVLIEQSAPIPLQINGLVVTVEV